MLKRYALWEKRKGYLGNRISNMFDMEHTISHHANTPIEQATKTTYYVYDFPNGDQFTAQELEYVKDTPHE